MATVWSLHGVGSGVARSSGLAEAPKRSGGAAARSLTRIAIRAVFIIPLLVAAFLGVLVSSAHAVDVTFTDPNLEAFVRSSLPIPISPLSPVTDADMATLGTLTVHGGITDLEGLQYATALTSLDLEGNSSLTSIAQLSGVMSLTTLNLNGDQVTDISPLTGHSGLTSLNVNGNPFSDFSPLASLSGLTSLDIVYCQMSDADLSYLSNLTGLTYLNLALNQLSDLTPISGLTALTTLAIANNQISDIGPLANFHGLTQLAAPFNPLSDISPLAGLNQLQRVSLIHCQISDLSPLSGLTDMRSLYLSNNQISDVSQLSGLTLLQYLTLDQNQISSISGLSPLTNLLSLGLSQNQISDVSPLSQMHYLMSLGFADNHVADISTLSGLTALTSLSASNNQISNISALSSLAQLTQLRLANNDIADVSPLTGLSELFVVDLGHNLLTDISPLVANLDLSGAVQIYVANNYLDLTPGSPSMNDINTLSARNTWILDYLPQNADHAPVATAVTASTNQGVAVPVTLTATDADGNQLIYSIVAPPGHGTLGAISGNSVTYTPASGYTGPDTFTFKANDGQVDSNVVAVSITVSAVNHAPVATAVTASTNQGVAVPITLTATDADGNPLTYSIVSGPTHGTLGAISVNSVTYTPASGYTGSDTFTFKANDGQVDSNVVAVSITVSAVNHAPVAAAGTALTHEGAAISITLAATDADANLLTYSVVAQPAHGTLGAISGSSVTYTPASGYTGSDSFTFKANDGQVDSNVVAISITVDAQPAGATLGSILTGNGIIATAGQVTVTFPHVASGGSLVVAPLSTPTNPVPGSFEIVPGLTFEIYPTTTWSGGPATVEFQVPSSYTGSLSGLVVYHWLADGTRVDITPTVDLIARTLTFTTTSFSEFGVGEPITAPTTSTPASSGWSVAIGALIALGMVAASTRKRSSRVA